MCHTIIKEETMTLLKDLNGDCYGCPVKRAELCSGGFSCYGGEPIEPPCCGMDEDTDLDAWVDDAIERERRYQKYLEEKAEKERLKKEKAAKAAETKRAMRYYCTTEISALKRAKKALKSYESLERMASSLAQAFNITNEMFRYEERFTVKPEASENIKRLQEEVARCEDAYKAKRKEFYQKRKNRLSNVEYVPGDGI